MMGSSTTTRGFGAGGAIVAGRVDRGGRPSLLKVDTTGGREASCLGRPGTIAGGGGRLNTPGRVTLVPGRIAVLDGRVRGAADFTAASVAVVGGIGRRNRRIMSGSSSSASSDYQLGHKGIS